VTHKQLSPQTIGIIENPVGEQPLKRSVAQIVVPPTSMKRVHFSDKSTLIIVEDLSIGHEASKLWYSPEDIDLFKEYLSFSVHIVHSCMKEQSIAHLDILGLEKYLSPQLTDEFMNRRNALKQSVLEEHRWQRATNIPHITRLAILSARKSRWAREKARAAALFLEEDVMNDLEGK